MAERRRDTEWSHPPLEPLCPRTVARGTLVRGLAPTGYKFDAASVAKAKGLRLGSIEQTLSELQREKRVKKNVQRSYICSVMAGHHCCSARAFAVNPSRLPARPSGLRGLTAQRGQARRPAVPSNAELRLREPLETERKKC